MRWRSAPIHPIAPLRLAAMAEPRRRRRISNKTGGDGGNGGNGGDATALSVTSNSSPAKTQPHRVLSAAMVATAVPPATEEITMALRDRMGMAGMQLQRQM